MNTKITSVKEKDIPFFKKLAEELSIGRASLMVGSGFSLNADPTTETSKRSPLLNDLKEVFGKELYDGNQREYSKYSVAQISLQYEEMFGRDQLHLKLAQSIPNESLEPGRLFQDVIRLPWVDIFTTNYDNLLEKANSSIQGNFRHYSVVTRIEDLAVATRPRIIKLHGSFPSTFPLIITEEDYRIYPHKFAPFVNTVQQSLLENTFCLLGFSSDDENFLHWIGWIRDNLHDNSNKIYMIGVSEIGPARERILHKRNINYICLNNCKESCNRKKAIRRFFAELNSAVSELVDQEKLAIGDFVESIAPQKKKSQESVPVSIRPESLSQLSNPNLDSGSNDDTKSTISRKKPYDLYPGWFICPTEYRARIQTVWEVPNNTDRDEEKLEHAYHYCWKINKCCTLVQPSFVAWIDGRDFEEVVASSQCKDKYTDWVGYVYLTLMIYYRHCGDLEKWESLKSKVTNLVSTRNDPFQEAWLNYENCLLYKCELKVSELIKELEKWNLSPVLYDWRIRKASLLSECGCDDEAFLLLKQTYDSINNDSELGEVRKASLISETLFRLKILSNIKQMDADDLDFQYDEIRLRFDPQQNTSRLYRAYADPALFFHEENPSILFVNTNHQKELSTQDPDFLIYSEFAGIPTSWYINLFQLALGANKTIPLRQLVSLILWSRSSKAAALFLTRKKLFFSSKSELKKCIDSLTIILKKHPAIFDEQFISNVLSRVIISGSVNQKLDIIRFVQKRLNRSLYAYIQYHSLLSAIVESLSDKELPQILPLLLSFPLIDNSTYLHCEPCYHLHSRLFYKKTGEGLRIDERVIEDLIKTLRSNNRIHAQDAVVRLLPLAYLGVLSKSKKQDVEDAIWSNIDSNGFPNLQDMGIALLHPFLEKNKDKLEQLLNNFFVTKNFRSFVSSDGKYSSRDGEYELQLRAFGQTFSDNTLRLSNETICGIFRNFVLWWNNHKRYFLKKDFLLSDFLLVSLKDLVYVMLPISVLSTASFCAPLAEDLVATISEIEKVTSSVVCKSVIYRFLSREEKKSYVQQLKIALSSRDIQECRDAGRALAAIFIVSNDDSLRHLIVDILCSASAYGDISRVCLHLNTLIALACENIVDDSQLLLRLFTEFKQVCYRSTLSEKDTDNIFKAKLLILLAVDLFLFKTKSCAGCEHQTSWNELFLLVRHQFLKCSDQLYFLMNRENPDCPTANADNSPKTPSN